VHDTVILIGSTMCRLLYPIGAIDGSVQVCGEPRDMLVFGGMMILMGGIAVTMASVMGRNVRPKASR
jgi:hypothetical protein